MQVSFFNRNTVNVELFQYDYGQALDIKGLTLPKEFEVHYQNGTNTPVTVKGTFDEIAKVGKVNIPDECLQQDVQQFKAWLWVSDEKSGKTLKTIRFYLQQRDKPSNVPPISSVTEIKGYADYVKENAQKVAVAEQVGKDLLAKAESGAFNGKQGPPGIPGKNGEQGPPGKDGVAGKTPVKGVDYWTNEDKTEIDSHIDSIVKQGNFAEKALLVNVSIDMSLYGDDIFFSNVSTLSQNITFNGTSSHSLQQIIDAYNQGRTVFATSNYSQSFVYSLVKVNTDSAIFINSVGVNNLVFIITVQPNNSAVLELKSIVDLPVTSVNGLTGEVVLKTSDLQNDSRFVSDSYVKNQIKRLVGSAPETLDTLGEIAKALQSNETATGAIVEQLGQKANSADLSAVSKSGSYNDLKDKPTVVIGDKTYTIKVSTLVPTVDDKNVITFVV